MVPGAQDPFGAADLGARGLHSRRDRRLGNAARNHGKFGLDKLLQPAIKAAEQGYVVAPRIAFDWKNQFEKLKNGTNTGRYLLPHGKPAVAGDVIRQAELGKTLRAIAKDGRDAFYTGESPRTWSRPCAASAACTRWRTLPPHH